MFGELMHYAKQNKDCIIYEEKELKFSELMNNIAYNQKYLISQDLYCGKEIVINSETKFDTLILFISLMSVEAKVLIIDKDLSEIEASQIINEYGLLQLDDFTKKYLLMKKEYLFSINQNFLEPNEQEAAVYQLTSGSSGRPKLCKTTIKNLSLLGKCYNNFYRLNSDDQVMVLGPLKHSFPFAAGVVTALTGGLTLHILEKFHPVKIIEYLRVHTISYMVLVPVMARLLCLAYDDKLEPLLSGKSIAVVGAGIVSKAVYEDFFNKYKVKLLNNYGCTETGGVICTVLDGVYGEHEVLLPGVITHIVNKANKVDEDEIQGELFVKTPWMMDAFSYCNDNRKFSGWYKVGDYVRRDQNGYYHIVGRKKNMVCVGGKKVDPTEIEQFLMSHREISDCRIFGKTNHNDEEVLIGVVETLTLKSNEINRILGLQFGRYKIPSILVTVAHFRRNEMGKVNLSQFDKIVEERL